MFSLLLAMAALGLSMIFGTTGLTNFAHGELITFGALVAYGVDQLPGDDHVGGTNITVVVARDRRRSSSPACFGWLKDCGPLATAAQPRHRPDRHDDRQHRPVDLPAQRLPVLRRRDNQNYSPVRQPSALRDRPDPDHAEGRS